MCGEASSRHPVASSLPGHFARQGSSQTGLFARESRMCNRRHDKVVWPGIASGPYWGFGSFCFRLARIGVHKYRPVDGARQNPKRGTLRVGRHCYKRDLGGGRFVLHTDLPHHIRGPRTLSRRRRSRRQGIQACLAAVHVAIGFDNAVVLQNLDSLAKRPV